MSQIVSDVTDVLNNKKSEKEADNSRKKYWHKLRPMKKQKQIW